MIRLCVWLMLFALPATAQELPALYSVTNVAPDDTLNIRAQPEAGAPILGTLAADAKNVEVIRLSENKRWGVVNAYDRAGWTSMAYLTAQPARPLISQNMQCHGTEPFWSVRLSDKIAFDPMDGPSFSNNIDLRTLSVNRSDRIALTSGTASRGATAIVTRRACSDGMADAEYGLSVDLLINANGDQSYLSGCCTLLAD